MSAVTLMKKYVCPKDQLLACDARGEQSLPGFIGRFACGNVAITVLPLDAVYETHFPDPATMCGGGDRSKNPQCDVQAPGASHPGVVMIDEFLYTTRIDIVI